MVPVPPEHAEAYARTANAVQQATGRQVSRDPGGKRAIFNHALGSVAEATHEGLILGGKVLGMAPIPGLGEAADLLLHIWDTVEFVEVSFIFTQ